MWDFKNDKEYWDEFDSVSNTRYRPSPNLDQPRSTNINKDQPRSTKINQDQPRSMGSNLWHGVSTKINGRVREIARAPLKPEIHLLQLKDGFQSNPLFTCTVHYALCTVHSALGQNNLLTCLQTCSSPDSHYFQTTPRAPHGRMPLTIRAWSTSPSKWPSSSSRSRSSSLSLWFARMNNISHPISSFLETREPPEKNPTTSLNQREYVGILTLIWNRNIFEAKPWTKGSKADVTWTSWKSFISAIFGALNPPSMDTWMHWWRKHHPWRFTNTQIRYSLRCCRI